MRGQQASWPGKEWSSGVRDKPRKITQAPITENTECPTIECEGRNKELCKILLRDIQKPLYGEMLVGGHNACILYTFTTAAIGYRDGTSVSAAGLPEGCEQQRPRETDCYEYRKNEMRL